MDTTGTDHAARRRRGVAPVTVRVPAKINLQLSVGPCQPDGYHDLATVFQAVSLYDDVTVETGPRGAGIRVLVTGDEASEVPVGPGNLAARAAAALADAADTVPDVTIRITKGIPVAGGMAGGSADAAASLVACDALWGAAMQRSELMEIAAGLGSDIPFLLTGGTAIGTGRGDRLTPVLTIGEFHWVVATAHQGLSTPAVYRRFDEIAAESGREVPPPELDEELMAALRSGDAVRLGSALSNDLQAPAVSIRPSLAPLMELGRGAGALGALVSGSGPTVAFLVADAEAAMAVTMVLSPSGLCRTVRQATGPVAGARVIAA